MRRTKRHHLRFDALEDKTLMSVAHHALRAGGVKAAAAVRQSDAIAATQAPTTPVGDVQGLQQHSSSDHLVVFLANLGVVLSNRTDVQQFATQILKTHESGDEQIEMAAQSANILLPSDISEASDQMAARQVLQAVNTNNFDTMLLSTLSRVEGERADAAQALINRTSNTAIKQAVQPEIADDRQTAQQAMALLSNPGPTDGLSMPNGPSSPMNDAEYVQAAHSTNLTEIFISQAAALSSANSGVQQYAKKLISDHHQGDMQASELASYLGQDLSPTLSPTDLSNARQVLSALNTPRFDQVYLSTNVTAHQMDKQTNQQEIARTQDPNIRQYAMDDIPTDNLHEVGAQTLLNGTGGNGIGGFTGFENSGVTNVRVRSRVGNRRAIYQVAFDANNVRYSQTYTLNLRQLQRTHNGSFTPIDAANLFVQALNSEIQQLSSGSGGNITQGVTVKSHAVRRG